MATDGADIAADGAADGVVTEEVTVGGAGIEAGTEGIMADGVVVVVGGAAAITMEDGDVKVTRSLKKFSSRFVVI